MFVRVILEFRPHAQGKLFHRWKINFVLYVLENEIKFN